MRAEAEEHDPPASSVRPTRPFMRHCNQVAGPAAALVFASLLVLTATSTGMSQAVAAASGRQEHVLKLGEANTLGAEFQVGPAGKVGVLLKFANGQTNLLRGTVKPDLMMRTVDKDGRKVPEQVPLPDGFVEFQGPGLRFNLHSRPNLARYTEAQRAGLAQVWETLPAASQRWVPLEVRADAAGAELWFEGRYCGRLTNASRLVELTLQLEAGGAVRGALARTRAEDGRFLTLDVRHIGRPGVLETAKVSLAPGRQQLNAVPMIVADGRGNADVGRAKEMQGSRALETDENTSRTSLDAMPESLHFSVPPAFYHRAWVLCAVEADPAKDPVLTTRLTRFGVSGRGGAMADTSLTLPRGGEPPGAGIQPVGNVTYAGANGKPTTTPLYLVRVDLKTGDILDLIADTQDPYAAMKIGPYLDFEFLGKCGGLQVQRDRRRKPVPTSTSAVHVFGVTLEQSPVEVRLKQAQPGNIFHNAERPETTFSLRAVTAGRYSLRWEITDLAGEILARHERPVTLDKAGSEADVTLPLTMPEVGWYGLRVTLADQAGQPLLQHSAAFALLGKDTRKAGYDSPFGTWWFNGVHYTTKDVNVAGPMLFKAGFRRTTMGWTKDGEAELAAWQISLNQINWPFRLVDLKDWPAAEVRAEKTIGDLLKRFPHCQYIDLFHESYDPGAYPPELYGAKYAPKDAAFGERDDQLYELGLKAAKFIRAKFPQLKIIAGNSGGSSGMVAVLLRRGFPRELIDYLGSETTGQTIAPEKLSPHTTAGIWLLGETARKFGYEIPLAGCFEFTCRAERDLGPQRLAEWYARDMLIGLANRFPTISPAVIEDVGNSYYDTLWGASGLCQRHPLHYPKPGYVALATLTKVLDRAKLVRQIPTGSASAHALEFERGGERIYALWTPRGQCELEVEFPAGATVTQVGFYGELRATKGQRLTITASTAASYLVSSMAATRVTAGRRSFPQHQPPVGTQVISSMADLAHWQLSPETLPATALRRPGKFALGQVNDAEKGACLELELQPQGEVPSVVGEYTAVRLKQPLPIAGKPHTVGVWVKGDSSWGRIFWELEDAKGERWRSCNDVDGGDWGNQAAIDFDGWCFLTFPLTDDSPVKHIEPGAGLRQWQGNIDGKLDYPLKLVGLYVETHRQSLNLTRMEPVKGRLRLKDVSAMGEAR